MIHRISASIALGVLLLAGPVSAHHNMSAIFDFNNRITLTGTFARMDWRNPHIDLFVDVKQEGGPQETWRAEGPAPNVFRNFTASKADFEKALGKALTLEVSRARDGSQYGLLRTITLPDGKVVNLCPQNC